MIYRLLLYGLPLACFIFMISLFALKFQHQDQTLPSALIGQPAPMFDLPSLDAQKRIKLDDLKGDVILLNIWASWCHACLDEHALLLDISKHEDIYLYGLNYKDSKENAKAWLADLGNPYIDNIVDSNGNTAIDYGVYGVPETFLLDHHRIIRYRHVGPISRAQWHSIFLPLIQQYSLE